MVYGFKGVVLFRCYYRLFWLGDFVVKYFEYEGREFYVVVRLEGEVAVLFRVFFIEVA